MKKLIVSALFIFLLNISLHAQTDSAVSAVHYNFSYVIDTTQPESPNTEKMILYLGTNSSLYMSYDRILFNKAIKEKMNGGNASGNVREVATSGGVTNITVSDGGTITGGTFVGTPGTSINLGKAGTPGMLMKNNETTKLATFSSSYGKDFFIEEPMPAMNWQISTETKSIQGLACQKATTHFRGRDYEAWFCSQLPYNNGPWKLGGLPGLIIEASDSKKEVVFTFESFEDATGTHTPIEFSKKAIKTTAKELTQFNEAMKRDRAAMVNGMTSSAAGGGGLKAITVTGTFISPDGKQVKPKQQNNPIEKDEPVIK